MKTILNYFFRGMLILLPLGLTIYVAYYSVAWLNNTLNDLFFSFGDVYIPGLGILTAFILITLVGFIISRTFASPIVNYFERMLGRTPLINIVYTSLKDLTEAIVGDRKKFTKPVVVELGSSEVKRFGFITEESLRKFGLEDEVAVYCPHSYNVSGNLYLVPPERVKPIKTDTTNFMRFIISGGVTRMGS